MLRRLIMESAGENDSRGASKGPQKAAILVPLVLSLSLAPATARAQNSEADRVAAQAQDALDKKDYAAAAERFAHAADLAKTPVALIGLARADVGLGKWVAALEVYRRIVRKGAAASAPAPVLQAVKNAAREADALEPRVPRLVIQVKKAWNVTLDGGPVFPAALGVPRRVDPGSHTLKADGQGHVPIEITLTAVEGRTETVTLEPGARSPAPPPVAAPPPVVEPPPAPPPPPPPPASGASTRRVIGGVALGVGGATLVAGVVTGVLALGKRSDLQSSCPSRTNCPPGEQSTIDAYNTLGAVSTGTIVAGGALAVAGAIVLLTAPRLDARSGAWVTQHIGLGAKGLEGRF